MKLLKFAAVAVLFSIAVSAQGTVEKSIFNVQIGSHPLSVNHELGLGNQFALRTEFSTGLTAYWTLYDSGYAITPIINLEPRWYYNIKKRDNKGKRTHNNSASFVGLASRYVSNEVLLGGLPDYYTIPNAFSFIPKWGIRRSIDSSNFNYEVGIGIGYFFYPDQDARKYSSKREGTALDVHLRLGYTIK